MRVIPVIDLKGGQVVRAVAGRREAYQRIQSLLVQDPDPAVVARALGQFGPAEIYVADLDAIGGTPCDWDSYRAIAEAGAPLLVDAGIRDTERAAQLVDALRPGVLLSGIVAGLETLESLSLLEDLLKLVGPGQLVFSLDLKHGRPVSRSEELARQGPLEIARQAIALGVARIIVLDVANVGVGQGCSTRELCRNLRISADNQRDELELIVGGGIRDFDELAELSRFGVNAALVASALHDGRLSKPEIDRLRKRPSVIPHTGEDGVRQPV